MRFILLVIFMSVFGFCEAQTCDPPIDSSKIELYKKYIKKYRKKVQENKYFKSDLRLPSYEIANYLRKNNDTTYKYWYGVTIDNAKASYKKSSKSLKPGILYKMALSYY